MRRIRRKKDRNARVGDVMRPLANMWVFNRVYANALLQCHGECKYIFRKRFPFTMLSEEETDREARIVVVEFLTTISMWLSGASRGGP